MGHGAIYKHGRRRYYFILWTDKTEGGGGWVNKTGCNFMVKKDNGIN